MPRLKEVPYIHDREKEHWNLYGLQALAPERFARVVQRILTGRYLAFRPTTTPQIWP